MFSGLSKITHSIISITLALMVITGLSACKSEQPELMKAVKQFESDEIRDQHVAHMRINHMDALLHKRDETLYKGIRTKKYSMKACINCHVPEQHNGEVLRHTNPEHFCSTCHGYVAQKLDCFDCHVDHPAKESDTANSGTINQAADTPERPEFHQKQEVESQILANNSSDNHTNNKGEAANE